MIIEMGCNIRGIIWSTIKVTIDANNWTTSIKVPFKDPIKSDMALCEDI